MWKSAKTTATSATPAATAPVSVLASGSSLLISPGRSSGSTPEAPLGPAAATPLLGLGGNEVIGDLDPLLPEILDRAGVERRLGDLGGELRDVVRGPLEGRLLVLDPLRYRLHDLVHRVGREGLGRREADDDRRGPELAEPLHRPRRHPDPRDVWVGGLGLVHLRFVKGSTRIGVWVAMSMVEAS